MINTDNRSERFPFERIQDAIQASDTEGFRFHLHHLKQMGMNINCPQFESQLIRRVVNKRFSGGLSILINEFNFNINIGFPNGEGPLHQAVLNRDLGTVDVICRHEKADLNRRDNQGDTALHLAVLYNLSDIVKTLIQSDRNKTCLNETTAAGNTALHIAAGSGVSHRLIVSQLLQAGADVRLKNKDGLSPKFFALRQGLGEFSQEGLNPYEFEYDLFKKFGHIHGIDSTCKLMNVEVPSCMYSAPPFMLELSHVFEQNRWTFLTSEITDAFRDGGSMQDPVVTAMRIQEGKLTMISSGWMHHSVTLVFYNDMLVICNRGQGAAEEGLPTLQPCPIDPTHMTADLIELIQKRKDMPYEEGFKWLYFQLPEILAPAIVTLEMEQKAERICLASPALSKLETCSWASVKAALRASLLLLNPGQDIQTIIGWSKWVSTWLRILMLEKAHHYVTDERQQAYFAAVDKTYKRIGKNLPGFLPIFEAILGKLGIGRIRP